MKQLCPLAPLANDFATGVKKLIPMVFNHGNSVTNEVHYGVPMIMASHGYFVVSPNHFDGTSLYAINENGDEVWFDPAEGEEMLIKND